MKYLEEPQHQELIQEILKIKPVDEDTQHLDCSENQQTPTPRLSDMKILRVFNELMDTPLDFSAFVLNRLKVDTLTPELFAGPTYKLMKVNRESAHDVYSKHRILAVTKLKIVEWHNYKHLDWITVRRNDDKLYTFKEGDYSRLRLQDIKDMLLLLVKGKLTNLNIEERLALGVSLRMFTRIIVLRRRVEDLQLGVKSYQKKLNLTRLDTLIRIDKLHKFSDGTLNDVQSALDDILKRIRMEYLPQTVWRNVDPHGFEGIYKDGHGVKEFQRSFRHTDTVRLSRSDKVLKLKNFKKDAALKPFKLTYQERYEHVGPEVTSSQDGKVYKMAKRDYSWLMISRCSRSHFQTQDKLRNKLKT
ncbi:hypothetical protein Tco_0129459 [Tanacetum coccineum]